MRQGESRLDAESGTGRQHRDDFLAEDRPVARAFGPALDGSLDRAWLRAATISYTGLWQLRELDPAGEPEELRDARLELRRRFDAIDEDHEASRLVAQPDQAR